AETVGEEAFEQVGDDPAVDVRPQLDLVPAAQLHDQSRPLVAGVLGGRDTLDRHELVEGDFASSTRTVKRREDDLRPLDAQPRRSGRAVSVLPGDAERRSHNASMPGTTRGDIRARPSAAAGNPQRRYAPLPRSDRPIAARIGLDSTKGSDHE